MHKPSVACGDRLSDLMLSDMASGHMITSGVLTAALAFYHAIYTDMIPPDEVCAGLIPPDLMSYAQPASDHLLCADAHGSAHFWSICADLMYRYRLS